MNFIIADDNKFALDALENDLKAVRPDDSIHAFSLPSEVLEYVNTDCPKPDVAFLDVEMPGMSGIELAMKIKMKFPRTIVIFVSAYPQYAVDAFKIHANGYLVKPASRESIENELAALTQPFVSAPTSRVRAQTFGNFELFVDDIPVKFARSKSKELIAYLIDRRGATCTMNELAAILFSEDGDDKKQQDHIRHLISDVKTTLQRLKASEIIRKERNGISINVSEIDCDYYRMLQGEPTAVNQFRGEYMSNYGWCECKVGELIRISPQQK